MPDLFAQPYDLCASGFYFSDYEQYQNKSKDHINDYGDKVEEYEIQFIDGEHLDYELYEAYGVNQSNLQEYFNLCAQLDEDHKLRLIVSAECGYDICTQAILPDIDIYKYENLNSLAEMFIDEGLFGEISDSIRHYIDIDAVARDLSVDYTETTIANTQLVYRCP